MDFQGVLFILGKPSARPPNGTNGRRILLLPSVVEESLYQYRQGLPLYASSCLTKHDYTEVGRIEHAEIVGDMFVISGFLQQAKPQSLTIGASTETLGLSLDATNCHIKNLASQVYEVTKGTFFGATVMKQSHTAFREDCLFWLA